MVTIAGQSEIEYLHRVEALARAVVEEAAAEQRLEFGDAGQAAATPLFRAINELASSLRFHHDEHDRCS